MKRIPKCVCADQAGSGYPGVGLASQQKGYPSIHFMQHEKDQAVATAQDHAIVLDPLPCHVAHLA